MEGNEEHTREQRPENLLDVRELCVEFGEGKRVVDGVSFTLRRGETVGIVGESGSGKSLTALSIMRLLPPTAHLAGAIHLAEPARERVDLLALSESRMRRIRGRRIAMIFQEPMTSLNPVIRCGEQIDEAIRLHQGLNRAGARRETLRLLERVKLPDPERICQAYPHQLSGGQKQRIMIAMALSCNPDILIADEPTTALDVTVQQAILSLMKELRGEWNGAIIFISHDLGVVAEIADRVLVMQAGRIVETGSVREVFRQPKHPYTRGLLACRPPLDYRPRRLPVIDDFLEGTPGPAPTAIPPEQTRRRLQDLRAHDPILTVRDLHTWFATGRNVWGRPRRYIRAVDGVSFDVYPGETLGLVGESGCGKTTLGRSLLHLIPPRQGSIRFRGRELSGLPATAWKTLRRDMQIVFQDPYASLNPRRTIGEAIIEPLRVHGIGAGEGERRRRVEELLETVQLEAGHYHRYPHEFSGGQRQRICIARALAPEPRFLICDESVSSLDVSVQAQILNLLMDLRDRYQLTMIFISHDLSVVKLMSDRLAVMHMGRIEEIGPSEDVYQNPRSPYTRRLIDAIPRGV